MHDLNKYKDSQNFAAKNYYLQLLLKVEETPVIKAILMSKIITFISVLLPLKD